MYRKPKVVRFGTLRDLTKVGCFGASDNETFMGGVAVGGGETPIVSQGTTFWCFVNRS